MYQKLVSALFFRKQEAGQSFAWGRWFDLHIREMGKERVTELEERHMQRRKIPPYVGQAVWTVIWLQKRYEEFGGTGRSPRAGPEAPSVLAKETELDPNGSGEWLRGFRGKAESDNYFLLRGWGRRTDRDSVDLGGEARAWEWSLSQCPLDKEEKLRRCHGRRRGTAPGEGGEEPREESTSGMSEHFRGPPSRILGHMEVRSDKDSSAHGAEGWGRDHKGTNRREKRSPPEKQKAIKKSHGCGISLGEGRCISSSFSWARNKGRSRCSLWGMDNSSLSGLTSLWPYIFSLWKRCCFWHMPSTGSDFPATP